MSRVPRSAALLTAAGVLPFVAGASLTFAIDGSAPQAEVAHPVVVARDGLRLLLIYGLIIFAYMAGCFWGFAAKSQTATTRHYVLAVLPAIYALFNVGPHLFHSDRMATALLGLLVGFIGLLAFDSWFQREGLAPPWWMRLRIPATIGVVLCLGLGWINT